MFRVDVLEQLLGAGQKTELVLGERIETESPEREDHRTENPEQIHHQGVGRAFVKYLGGVINALTQSIKSTRTEREDHRTKNPDVDPRARLGDIHQGVGRAFVKYLLGIFKITSGAMRVLLVESCDRCRSPPRRIPRVHGVGGSRSRESPRTRGIPTGMRQLSGNATRRMCTVSSTAPFRVQHVPV